MPCTMPAAEPMSPAGLWQSEFYSANLLEFALFLSVVKVAYFSVFLFRQTDKNGVLCVLLPTNY